MGIKKDRIQFFEDIAKEADIASRVGDSKGVYSALRKAAEVKGGAMDLRNADVDKFVQHFQDVVGALRENLMCRKNANQGKPGR